MSEWIGILVAGLALALSAATWLVQFRRQSAAERSADVTVFFHWLPAFATVDIQGGQPLQAGYHLVLTNRGPATATAVSVTLRDASGETLTLLDLAPGELPLSVLDAKGNYPIPFVYEPFTRHARRFEATLAWTDGHGLHERVVPLRRGQTPI